MNKELNLKIEDLFTWKGSIDITDNDGNVVETLYQRVINDADMQKTRLESLKETRLFRRALKDPNSLEYLASFPEEDDMSLDDLIAGILGSKFLFFRKNSQEIISEKKVKEPGFDSEQEEQEDFIAGVEDAKKEYEIAILEDAARQAEAMEADLRSKTHSEVFEIYKKEQIETLCRTKMINSFLDYATFYGTFKDEKLKQRRFNSVEDFRNLSTKVKNLLIANYQMLEISLTDVKK